MLSTLCILAFTPKKKSHFNLAAAFSEKKRGKPLKIVEKTDITVYVLRDNNQIVKIVSYAEEIRDAASI